MNQAPNPTKRGLLGHLALLLLALFASCNSYEDKRVRELLHERGFGSRADGEATRENYLGGSDVVQFIVPPEVLLQPGAEQLAELQQGQTVAIDGIALGVSSALVTSILEGF